ncbi:MAG: type IV pili twitching motility protein PilT, partial [Clostridia bacterium]|nr:type IV pili twitching motility protein PilT [Clostridia bacterium]
MTLDELLKYTVEQGASDLHITVGIPPVIRKNGKLVRIGEDRILPSDTDAYVKEMLNEEQLAVFLDRGELDLSFSLQGVGRFRANVFKQRGTCCIA